jgi:hypothetical protein
MVPRAIHAWWYLPLLYLVSISRQDIAAVEQQAVITTVLTIIVVLAPLAKQRKYFDAYVSN